MKWTALLLFPLLALAQTPKAAAPPGTSSPAKPQRENGLYATLQTSMGDITAKLFETESPITVKNFTDLAMGRKAWTDPKTKARTRRPLYNGTIFHRVLPNFMIQGGDPMGTGMGGSDVIKDEFHPSLRFDQPGRLAMANAGPGTGSSQFFITEVPTPWLDGKHTIFGQVVEGQDLVTKIANVPRDPQNNKPNTPVVIKRIVIERVGPGAPVTGAPASAAKKPAATTTTTTPKPKPTTTAAPAKKQ